MKRRIFIGLVLVVVALGAWFLFAPRPGLMRVDDIEAFRREFNASADSVRVVALLSPT